MAGYGWEEYDVRTGGRQVIRDRGNKVDITTEFVKVAGGDNGEHLPKENTLEFRGLLLEIRRKLGGADQGHSERRWYEDAIITAFVSL